MLERSDPPIYIVTIDYADVREQLAWSARDKAVEYVEDRIPSNVSWDGSIKAGDSRMVAYDERDELVARVARIPIADPVSLSNAIKKWPSGPVFGSDVTEIEPISRK